MAEKWLVLKFGGTSVAGAQQWETIASIVRARRSGGYRVLLVCSAVSGVTNLLSALAEQPESETLPTEIQVKLSEAPALLFSSGSFGYMEAKREKA